MLQSFLEDNRNHDNQYELSEYFKDYYTKEMIPFFPSSSHTANIYYCEKSDATIKNCAYLHVLRLPSPPARVVTK